MKSCPHPAGGSPCVGMARVAAADRCGRVRSCPRCRGALRFGAFDAEFAGGGVDAAGLLPSLPMRRKLRRMRIRRQPHPFRNVLASFQHRQFGAVEEYNPPTTPLCVGTASAGKSPAGQQATEGPVVAGWVGV